jgi:2-polyprenyl-3-methyl-5-hydroxy-6-metoxy-1,4-benzoquinol methylase
MTAMEKFSDKKIVDSWNKNVQPWVVAIREGEIESRLLVTNQAVVDAVLKREPKSALDVGCGEGWLVRALENHGIDTLGIDVVPELISHAQQEGIGRFKPISYEELSSGLLKETFDVVVCNFSLLGEESVVNLFKQAPLLLNEGGSLVVQTVHPVAGCGDANYEDGWREGSWAGFNNRFRDPAPWYFRTMESWRNLFLDHGFGFNDISEPVNPKTNTPASVVFTGVLNTKG